MRALLASIASRLRFRRTPLAPLSRRRLVALLRQHGMSRTKAQTVAWLYFKPKESSNE